MRPTILSAALLGLLTLVLAKPGPTDEHLSPSLSVLAPPSDLHVRENGWQHRYQRVHDTSVRLAFTFAAASAVHMSSDDLRLLLARGGQRVRIRRRAGLVPLGHTVRLGIYSGYAILLKAGNALQLTWGDVSQCMAQLLVSAVQEDEKPSVSFEARIVDPSNDKVVASVLVKPLHHRPAQSLGTRDTSLEMDLEQDMDMVVVHDVGKDPDNGDDMIISRDAMVSDIFQVVPQSHVRLAFSWHANIGAALTRDVLFRLLLKAQHRLWMLRQTAPLIGRAGWEQRIVASQGLELVLRMSSEPFMTWADVLRCVAILLRHLPRQQDARGLHLLASIAPQDPALSSQAELSIRSLSEQDAGSLRRRHAEEANSEAVPAALEARNAVWRYNFLPVPDTALRVAFSLHSRLGRVITRGILFRLLAGARRYLEDTSATVHPEQEFPETGEYPIFVDQSLAVVMQITGSASLTWSDVESCLQHLIKHLRRHHTRDAHTTFTAIFGLKSNTGSRMLSEAILSIRSAAEVAGGGHRRWLSDVPKAETHAPRDATLVDRDRMDRPEYGSSAPDEALPLLCVPGSKVRMSCSLDADMTFVIRRNVLRRLLSTAYNTWQRLAVSGALMPNQPEQLLGTHGLYQLVLETNGPSFMTYADVFHCIAHWISRIPLRGLDYPMRPEAVVGPGGTGDFEERARFILRQAPRRRIGSSEQGSDRRRRRSVEGSQEAVATTGEAEPEKLAARHSTSQPDLQAVSGTDVLMSFSLNQGHGVEIPIQQLRALLRIAVMNLARRARRNSVVRGPDTYQLSVDGGFALVLHVTESFTNWKDVIPCVGGLVAQVNFVLLQMSLTRFAAYLGTAAAASTSHITAALEVRRASQHDPNGLRRRDLVRSSELAVRDEGWQYDLRRVAGTNVLMSFSLTVAQGLRVQKRQLLSLFTAARRSVANRPNNGGLVPSRTYQLSSNGAYALVLQVTESFGTWKELATCLGWLVEVSEEQDATNPMPFVAYLGTDNPGPARRTATLAIRRSVQHDPGLRPRADGESNELAVRDVLWRYNLQAVRGTSVLLSFSTAVAPGLQVETQLLKDLLINARDAIAYRFSAQLAESHTYELSVRGGFAIILRTMEAFTTFDQLVPCFTVMVQSLRDDTPPFASFAAYLGSGDEPEPHIAASVELRSHVTAAGDLRARVADDEASNMSTSPADLLAKRGTTEPAQATTRDLQIHVRETIPDSLEGYSSDSRIERFDVPGTKVRLVVNYLLTDLARTAVIDGLQHAIAFVTGRVGPIEGLHHYPLGDAHDGTTWAGYSPSDSDHPVTAFISLNRFGVMTWAELKLCLDQLLLHLQLVSPFDERVLPLTYIQPLDAPPSQPVANLITLAAQDT
ncbi:MAG: hypothetical protein M1838_002642 [Thelocarpon superellum]|nr:MAG: hypothetical protein M1838_002642 [Thelocarpon superellum]